MTHPYEVPVVSTPVFVEPQGDGSGIVWQRVGPTGRGPWLSVESGKTVADAIIKARKLYGRLDRLPKPTNDTT